MYVADWPTHFLVVDIADPTQPSLLGMADTGFSDDVFVEGAFAYVINATFAGSVDVFDVTVPTNPSFYSGFITTQSNGSVTEVAAPIYL